MGVLLVVVGYVTDSRPDPYTDARLAMRRAAAVMALQEAAAMPNDGGEARASPRARGNAAGSSYLPYWALENETDAAGQTDGLQSAARGQGKGSRGAASDDPAANGAPAMPTGPRGNGRGSGGDQLEHGRRVRPVGGGTR